MGALPERGDLAATSLPALLLALLRERWGGVLVLQHGRVTKRISLREGRLVAAESSRPSESLVAWLLDSGRLAPEAAQRLTRRGPAAGEPPGGPLPELAAVRELGLVPAKELLVALREHLRRILLDAFAWSEGGFLLEPSREDAGGKAPGTDPIPLILEGVETRWGAERVMAELRDRAGRYPKATREGLLLRPRLASDPSVEALFDSLDGTRTLAQLLHAAATPRAFAAAWVLAASGALAFGDAPCAGPSDPAPAPGIEIEIVTRREAAPVAVEAPEARSAAEQGAADDLAATLSKEVREKHARLASLDHYEILGVARNAGPPEIRRAYVQAAKRFHPDAVARLGLDELKREANEVFARIVRAHTTLSDPGRRRDYDDSLADPAAGDASQLAQAEMLYRKATLLLRAGKFADAIRLLEPCVALWPEEPAYHSDLGWALFKQPKPALLAARGRLERALSLAPRDARAHLRLAVVLAALGDEAGASRERGVAQRFDPKVTTH
jgi:tetratricopeptide (TPR) repeat protein